MRDHTRGLCRFRPRPHAVHRTPGYSAPVRGSHPPRTYTMRFATLQNHPQPATEAAPAPPVPPRPKP